jgi:TRAP transporter TAXI family solute receptor
MPVLAVATAIDLLRSGELSIVGRLWGGGAGWPGFTTVARGEKGARFVAPDADEIRRILARHAFLKPVTQPAGSFPGQDRPIPSVGSWSFVLARPGLDDAVTYRLAKALHELERQGGAPRQLVDTTAKNTVAAAPADRLHPGVARYFKETGLLRP